VALAAPFMDHVEASSDHTVHLLPFGTLGESDDIMEQTQVFFVSYLRPQGFQNETGSTIDTLLQYDPVFEPRPHRMSNWLSRISDEAFEDTGFTRGVPFLTACKTIRNSGSMLPLQCDAIT